LLTVSPRPPRRQTPDVRREQLLNAAETVLVREGLRSTTVADVAVEAGVAKGTTYLYFRSKDELIAALRARYLERFIAALTGDLDAPAAARLDAVVLGLFGVAVEHHDLHHALFHEAGFSEADAFVAVRDLLEQILASGSEDGELAVDDVATTASFLLHGIHGALVDAMHPGDHGGDDHHRHHREHAADAGHVAAVAERVVELVRRTTAG
jgi:AcrR family transcriptional regulator